MYLSGESEAEWILKNVQDAGQVFRDPNMIPATLRDRHVVFLKTGRKEQGGIGGEDARTESS